MIDLRVDDHPDPIGKLAEILDMHDMYFGSTEVKIPMEGETCRQVQTALASKGFYTGAIDSIYGERTQAAFAIWCGMENYEERICEGAFIDENVLNILLNSSL